MGDTPSLITKLGYDPTDLAKGLEQARADVTRYKVDAVAIETELKNAKLQLLTQYSAANRAAAQERIADLKTEIAQTLGSMNQKTAAEKAALSSHLSDLRTEYASQRQILDGYTAQVQKVNDLKAAYISASQAAKQSSLAASIFGQATGQPTIIGVLQQQLEKLGELSPGLSAVTANIARIGQLLVGGGFASGAGGGGALTSEVASLSSAGLSLTAVIGGLTAGFVALAVSAGAVAKGMIEEAQAISNTAAATGLTNQQVQVYNQLAKEMGLSTDAVTQAFARTEAALGKFLITGQDAEGSTQQFVKALTAFGIKLQDSQGQLRPINDILVEFAAATDKISSPTERAAIRLDALGPRAKVLAQIMEQATREGKSFGEMLDEIGKGKFILSDADISLLQRAKVSIDEVTRSVKGYFTEIKTGVLESFGAAFDPKFAEAQKQALQETLSKFPKVSVTSPEFVAEEKRRTNEILNPKAATDSSNIPQIEPESVTKARAELQKAIADGAVKQLTAEQQILEINRQLDALKRSEANLKGDVLAENIKEQAHLQTLLNEASKTSQTQALTAAKDIQTASRALEKAFEDYSDKLSQAHHESSATLAETFFPNAPGELPGPSSQSRQEISALQEHLVELQRQRNALSVNETANAKQIVEIIRQEAEVVQKIGDLRVKQLSDQTKAAQKQLGEVQEIDKAIGAAAGSGGLLPIFDQIKPKTPKAPIGAQDASFFQSQLTEISANRATNQTTPEQELAQLKDLASQLRVEAAIRESILGTLDKTTTEYQKQREELQKVLDILGKVNQETQSASTQTGLGSLVESFKDFSNIIGQFSASFSKSFGQTFAGIKASFEAISDLGKLGIGTRDAGGEIQNVNFLDAVKNLFTGTLRDATGSSKKLSFDQRIQGVLDLTKIGASIIGNVSNIISGQGGVRGSISGGLSGLAAGAEIGSIIPGLGTAAGAIIGGIAGAIGGVFGGQKKQQQAQDKANKILDEANKVVQNLNVGTVDLKTAITLLQGQLAQTNSISGKGTDSIKQNAQQNIQNEINQLQAQQKQILDTFQQQLGLLKVPDGARSAAQAIQQIAQALKQAADAGASATDQIDFFNASVAELSHQLGDTLTQDEQNILGMLRQDIDLRQQQQDIIQNAADQERQIRQSLGLQRTLTPAQQAAQQIAAIEKQKNTQLAALKEQQDSLEAQINGQAELFGYSVKDLANADAKQKIIAAQLDIEKKMTAEIVAQIKAQQDFYNSLLSGKIPSLPEGLLPPGFQGTGSTTYTFQPGAIVINTGPGTSAADLAAQLMGALQQANTDDGSGQQYNGPIP